MSWFVEKQLNRIQALSCGMVAHLHLWTTNPLPREAFDLYGREQQPRTEWTVY